ncbi:TonB-dependent receptor [Dyadobacter sp. CY327]|uniref:SusC/RagA family TonB-linked outer membrane protein n=1 Tax=Dyadobacter sp. CY327 TaxID=2907301 RepID=UPI001F470194|nr:TonB-dependent receptor [Dyadobacter sp. CY327]MCE7070872.1 TonB-dependent receptor [Dyadobacter sp. CY327]
MKTSNKCFLPFLLLFLSAASFFTVNAQQQIIRGTVSSAVDGVPMPFVTVIVKGTQNGINTDANGKYEIRAAAGQSLIFSFIGYKTQEIAVGSQTELNVTLEEDATTLNEVVAIGYGSQSREQTTTAISKLDNRVLDNVPFANAASALQGTISGVRVQSTSGQPGAAPRVIVRGGTSINNPNGAAPLYIVDGVIRDNINDLNPSDIESMQVLKDAASTAIYGARGSNGVVIVTTKSGRSGKARISYSYDLTQSSAAKKYDLLSARDFIYFQRLGIAASAAKDPAQNSLLTQPGSGGTGNDLSDKTPFTTQFLTPENEHKLQEGWESMRDPLDPSKTIIFKDTDFQELLFKTGISHNHALSIAGGTEKATFSAGLGYLKSEGIAIASDFRRLTLNLNSELAVRNNVKVFGRLMYSNSASKEPYQSTNLFGRSSGLPPTAKYQFEDGTLAPGINLSIGNPEYIVSVQKGKNSNDKSTMVVGTNWNILPELLLTVQGSLYRETADSRSFLKAYLNGPGNLVNSRDAAGAYSKRIQYQTDATLSYSKSFNNVHAVDAMLGFSYYDRVFSTLTANGRGAASDLIPTLNSSAIPQAVGGTEARQVIAGYFGRVNYNFDQKYLLSVTSRYDGASNLGANYKWGFFPGISAGWNVHKEKFWQGLPDGLLSLKLRTSYGVNGNISQLGDYQAQGQYSVGSTYAGLAAIQNTSLANQQLKWEQSKTFDVGVDIGLFNNRISILVDRYRRVTDNLITSLALPHSTGFESILTNLGSLENKGIEVELSARITNSESAFSWDVSMNAAKVKNKILSLPYNGTENNRIGGIYVWDAARGDYAWMGGLQEGGRVGDMYAYKQMGIYATDEAAAAGPVDMVVPGADKTKYGGDVNWLDADGNNIIDEKDRIYVGNVYPTWTGGLTNSLGYKGFSFLVRLDFTTGHTIDHYTRGTFLGQYHGDNGLSSDLLRSWQNQGDVTDIPRFYWADQQVRSNLFRGNSTLYEKGDFLAVREATLSYTVPGKVLQKLKIASLRFNVTGNNLHYFTNFTGLNPEDGDRDNGRYPIPRNIIFGLNASF